jgi:hypothetical protein
LAIAAVIPVTFSWCEHHQTAAHGDPEQNHAQGHHVFIPSLSDFGGFGNPVILFGTTLVCSM